MGTALSFILTLNLHIIIREMCTQSNEAYNAVKKSRETDDDYEAVLEVEQYPLPPSTPSLPLHTTT